MIAAIERTILGLGCDLLRIERIARMGARNSLSVLDRILAPAERRELGGYGDKAADWPGCAPRIAGIVAAKEAFFKALGTGLVRPLRWVDVTVATARRTLDLEGAADVAFKALGGAGCWLTLSEDEAFVLSTVVILGPPPRALESALAGEQRV